MGSKTHCWGGDYYYQDGHYDANLYFPAPINIYNPVYGQPYLPPDPANDFAVHNGHRAEEKCSRQGACSQPPSADVDKSVNDFGWKSQS